MTQQTAPSYPNTASILSIVGASLIILSGIVLLAVSVFLIPHINQFTHQFNGTATWGNRTIPYQDGAIPHFVSFITGGIGLFGLVSGVIVLVSALMLRNRPSQRTLWGALILIFSVLSFFGTGGFLIGAILGIIGGIMALTWKPSTL